MSMLHVTILGTATACYIFLHMLLYFTQDRREPRPLATLLPFIGPMIGMSQKKTRFYLMLRDQHNLPIYTLRLPGSRIYVVNSPALVAAIQKQHQTLAFRPLVIQALMKVARFSKTAGEIVSTNANGEEGKYGYVMTFQESTYPHLAPGPHLDAMNRVMLELVATSLNRLRENSITKVRFFDWLTHQITLATTDAAYGPSNPYKDPSIEAAFWAYKSGMSNLILGLSFTQTAREAVHAMNQGAIAFESYYNNDSHMEGSTLIQARYNHSKDHHLPLNDIARSEFAHGIALLSNTVPNTFWMLYHIYSDPRLLAECRKELAHVIVAINDKQGKPTKTIDISKVKTSCPLFLSIYKEVLRFYSTSISARLVMEDFLLDNQYLLKKGSTVMMPNPVQHRNPALWGAQNDVFDPRRFTDAEKRHHPAGFRAFGGGTTLCPGRHFATTEILAFTAVMIMQFDIIPMSGEWPKELKTAVEFWEATPSPNQDFDVEIRPKDGEMGTGKWAFILSDLDRPIALSLEDETL